MNNYIFIIAVVIGFCSCEAETNTSDQISTDMVKNPYSLKNREGEGKMAKIVFEDTLYDIGKIPQGEKVYKTYKFTNEGEAPLLISEISASCGCTVFKNYPRHPIAPGEGGQIEMEFDSSNKWGEQRVRVLVSTNSIPAVQPLFIKTNIIVPDNMKVPGETYTN